MFAGLLYHWKMLVHSSFIVYSHLSPIFKIPSNNWTFRSGSQPFWYWELLHCIHISFGFSPPQIWQETLAPKELWLAFLNRTIKRWIVQKMDARKRSKITSESVQPCLTCEILTCFCLSPCQNHSPAAKLQRQQQRMHRRQQAQGTEADRRTVSGQGLFGIVLGFLGWSWRLMVSKIYLGASMLTCQKRRKRFNMFQFLYTLF